MKENMYDILRKAARKLKAEKLNCVECDCPVHGRFKVYSR